MKNKETGSTVRFLVSFSSRVTLCVLMECEIQPMMMMMMITTTMNDHYVCSVSFLLSPYLPFHSGTCISNFIEEFRLPSTNWWPATNEPLNLRKNLRRKLNTFRRRVASFRTNSVREQLSSPVNRTNRILSMRVMWYRITSFCRFRKPKSETRISHIHAHKWIEMMSVCAFSKYLIIVIATEVIWNAWQNIGK